MAQQLDRAEAAGDGVAAGPRGGSADVPARAGAGVSDAVRVPGEAGPAVDDETVAVTAGVAAGDVAGTGAAPGPYIQVTVGCTTPGLSMIPETVTWCPWVSVSRTVNGPGPAPDGAIQ